MKRLLLIILSAALVIWLVKPEILSQLANNAGKLMQKRIKKESRSVVTSAVSSVNKYVQEQSQAVLGEKIGINLQIKPDTEIVEDVPDQQLDNIILIDYATAKDLSLDLSANQTYYLDLRNVPEGYCLYVDQISYSVNKDEYLSLSFSNSGSYDLAFDKCDKKLQKFGRVVVE